uniref:Uncharacterized protein n=1 Tax=Helianthus annuus TaxID=4232 RepID=A0A251UKP3_HELAN
MYFSWPNTPKRIRVLPLLFSPCSLNRTFVLIAGRRHPLPGLRSPSLKRYMMQLIMRTTTCESIFLDVVGSDTFDNVMAKMKEMAHKCSFDYCLCLPSNSLIAEMLLCIRTTTGKTFVLKVVGLDTFDLVKAKIDDICSVDNHDLHWELIPKPKGWWWGECRYLCVFSMEKPSLCLSNRTRKSPACSTRS